MSLQRLSTFSFLWSRKHSALHRIIKMFSIVTFWNTFQMWNCSTDKRAGQGEDQLWQIITALLSHNYSALPQCLNSEFSCCKLLIATGVKTKKIIMLTPWELPPAYKIQKKIFNCLWWLHLNPYCSSLKLQNPYQTEAKGLICLSSGTATRQWNTILLQQVIELLPI